MDKHSLPGTLEAAIAEAAHHWTKLTGPWLVGGSCGLLLHGVSIAAPPRDVDLYIDAEDAAAFHRALSPYAVDTPCSSETERYRSILSHYRIGDVTLELVAGFEVRAEGAVYRIDIAGMLDSFALRTMCGGAPVGVMPLAHELAFNLLRGREDRYTAVAKTMRGDLPAHLPALTRIVTENVFSDAWLVKMADLLAVARADLVSREVR